MDMYGMNKEELREMIQRIKDYSKKTLKSKTKAIESLMKAGIYDEKGNLAEPYKNE